MKIWLYRKIVAIKNWYSRKLKRFVQLDAKQQKVAELLTVMMDDDNCILLRSGFKRIAQLNGTTVILNSGSVEIFKDRYYDVIIFNDSGKMMHMEYIFDVEVDKRVHYIDKVLHNNTIKNINDIIRQKKITDL